MIQQLYKVIEDYQPMGEQEIQDQKVMLDYIRLFDNILTRENAFAHMTSSPWIVNEDFTKVLLIYHRIYDSWGWCGGHCDGEEDLLEVAVKEGREETGLTSIRPLSKELMALDILPVPPHKKRGKFVSSHVHLNATFFCMADEKETLHHKEDENKGAMWVPLEEVYEKVNECDKDMIPVYKKLNEKLSAFAKDQRARENER